MTKSSSCDYGDAYIIVKETISVAAQARDNPNNGNKKEAVLKHCVPFTYYITEVKNTQRDDGKDVNVVMPIYNLTEYSNNYWKTSGSFQQYYTDEPALTNASSG